MVYDVFNFAPMLPEARFLLNCGLCIFHVPLRIELIKAQRRFIVCLMGRSKQTVKDYELVEEEVKAVPRAEHIYCRINSVCASSETSHNRDIKLCLVSAYDVSHKTTADERLRDNFCSVVFDLYIEKTFGSEHINILWTTFNSLSLSLDISLLIHF